MKAMIFSQYSMIFPTAVAFILFVSVFVGVFYLTYIRSNNKAWEQFASLPLDKGGSNDRAK